MNRIIGALCMGIAVVAQSLPACAQLAIPPGLPDDLMCKSAEAYSPCEAASAVAGELWVYAPQYRSACAKEPTYPDLVDCLSRHLWGVPFGVRKHYASPS